MYDASLSVLEQAAVSRLEIEAECPARLGDDINELLEDVGQSVVPEGTLIR
jgi:hypothetical protein